MGDHDERSGEEPPSRLTVFNGIWFRRERERVAIGRPAVAAHLGVTVGRVTALETKSLAVPDQWWPLLPALGFSCPSLSSSSQEAGQVSVEAEPVPPAVPLVTPIDERSYALQTHSRAPTLPDAAQLLPAQSATARGGQDAAPGGSTQQPEAINAAQVVTPPTAAEPVSTRPQARLPPAPSIPRGLWLRSRRLELGHSLQAMSKALGLSAHDLGVLEWQNLLIPFAWMSILASFRFCRWAPSTADQGPEEGQPSGAWLRLERQRKGLTIEICAINLGIRPDFLDLVELQDWPLTPEWLPTLAKLGFVGPGITPSSAVPIAAANAEIAPPQPLESALTDAEQNKVIGERTKQPVPASSGAAAKATLPSVESTQPRAKQKNASGARKKSEPAPLTGAWLRVHRLKRKLSMPQLAKKLKVSTVTLGRYERQDKPVRPDWLPLLSKLGLPVPKLSSDGEASPPPKPDPVTSARDLRPDGKWLRAERKRLGLDALALKKALGSVKVRSIHHIESLTDGRVPDSWLSTLSALGFRLPSHLASWSPSMIAGSPQHRGAWLLKARQRRKVSAPQVRRAVGVPSSTLTAMERHNRPLPAAWLPALAKLGLVVSGKKAAPPPRNQQEKTQHPTPAPASQPTASSAVAVEPGLLPSALSVEQRKDLVATIMNYRLNLGRSAGKPAFQVLGWIAQDMQQAGLEDFVTYEILHAALHALKQRAPC